jgi:hypothetical protein
VEDLDREVLAAFPEHLHLLLLEDLPGAVMRIDDVVAQLELDVLDLASARELLLQRCLSNCLRRNDVLLMVVGRPGAARVQVCR